MRWLAQVHPSLFRQIQGLPWVEDGLSEAERDAIDQLLYLGASDIHSLEATLGLPWVQDAISDVEYDVVYWIRAIAFSAGSVATEIVDMPFLRVPDSTDVLALRGIHDLAADKDRLAALVGHAAFLDGITQDEATLVAAAATLSQDEEISRLLDPGYASIEAVSGTTDLTSHLRLSIVRTGSEPQPWTAAALADAVDFAGRVLQLPLPVDHVIIVLNDKAVIANFDGTNHGFAIGFLPRYEQSQDTFERRKFQAGIVHEVAHYYWSGNEDWIDEGLARTIEYMDGVEKGLSAGQLKTQRGGCEAHDLEMLSEWDPAKSDPQFLCNYYLGTLLFLELRESLGGAEFSEKLRELYGLSLTEQEDGRTPDIAAVRQVFGDQASIVDKHWSGALNAPENRPFDEGLNRTSHDLIQWDQYPTYDGHSVSFSGTLLDDAVLSETIHEAGEGGGYANFTLNPADEHSFSGTIFVPLEDGRRWTLDDPGDTVATVYRLNERAFTVKFPYPQALGSPSDYIVIAWGYTDESRTPSIGDAVDIIGYARIRSTASKNSEAES